MYYEKVLTTDFILPEAYLYLDQKGYIQDDKDVPLIYLRHNTITIRN